MSFSFVVIDKQNAIDVNNLTTFLQNNYNDYELLYASTNAVSSQNCLKAYTISQSDDTESIINSIISKCTKQNIVVVRQFESFEKIKILTDNLKSPDSIVYFNKKNGAIKGFFSKIFNKLAQFFYSRKIIFASHAIICFGQNPSSVLKKLDFPSNAMRKFSWTGVSFVGLENGANYKMKYNLASNVAKTIVPTIFSIVLLVVYVLFRLQIPMLWEIVMLFTILIGFVLTILLGTNWFIKSQIGENNNKKSDIKEN